MHTRGSRGAGGPGGGKQLHGAERTTQTVARATYAVSSRRRHGVATLSTHLDLARRQRFLAQEPACVRRKRWVLVPYLPGSIANCAACCAALQHVALETSQTRAQHGALAYLQRGIPTLQRGVIRANRKLCLTLLIECHHESAMCSMAVAVQPAATHIVCAALRTHCWRTAPLVGSHVAAHGPRGEFRRAFMCARARACVRPSVGLAGCGWAAGRALT
jgi:hypothetical protein